MNKIVFTSLLSLFNAVWYLSCQYVYGWASHEATTYAFYIFCAYNIIDLIVGNNGLDMIIHHSVSIIGAIYFLFFLEGYPDGIRRGVFWLNFAEITSIFNALRYLAYGTKYITIANKAFGYSFLIVRPFMSIGCISALYQNEYIHVVFPIWLIITVLNTTWCYKIIKLREKFS